MHTALLRVSGVENEHEAQNCDDSNHDASHCKSKRDFPLDQRSIPVSGDDRFGPAGKYQRDQPCKRQEQVVNQCLPMIKEDRSKQRCFFVTEVDVFSFFLGPVTIAKSPLDLGNLWPGSEYDFLSLNVLKWSSNCWRSALKTKSVNQSGGIMFHTRETVYSQKNCHDHWWQTLEFGPGEHHLQVGPTPFWTKKCHKRKTNNNVVCYPPRIQRCDWDASNPLDRDSQQMWAWITHVIHLAYRGMRSKVRGKR